MANSSSADSFSTAHQPERRAFERVPLSVFGRCMFENKLEIPCQTLNISPGDMAVVAAHTPEMGENIIAYIDNIGRVSGPVARVFDGGFAMTFELSPRAQEKMVGKIAWCKEHVTFGAQDARRHERVTPRQPLSEIKLEDGRAYPIEIIDISLSGAAVSCQVRPAVGSRLTLGGMQGIVVRHFDEGLAIEFVTLQNESTINKRFV